MNDAEIKLKVSVDETGAGKQIDSLGKKADQISSKFRNAGKALTVGLTLPIVGAGVASVKFASDLEETMNKVDVSFGENAKTVKDWAKNSIKSMGLAQQSALDTAALFGDMGTGMGFDEAEAAEMSMTLTQLSADLASFKNIRQDVAETALKSIYTGETESLKGLGIVMTETNLEEFRRAKGIKKTMKEMTQAEKVQLRYQFVMDKTTKAQGDFSRTSGGMANQSRMAGEQLKELSTQMGVILLPIALKLVSGISKIVSWFTNLSEAQKKMILTVLGVVAAVGPLLMIIGAIVPGIQAVVAVIGFLASPIGLIVLAIGALIGVFVYLMATSEEFRAAMMNIFNAVWTYTEPIIKAIQMAIWGIVNIIKGAVKIIGGLLNGDMSMVMSGFKDLFKGIGNVVAGAFNLALKGIESFVNFALIPINALIAALNAVPGVNIKKVKLNIPKIPKLETGTNYTSEGLHYLHDGEAVVPKKYNPAAGGIGAGGKMTLYIEQPNIELDGRVVSRGITPYITKTVKLGGGNV